MKVHAGERPALLGVLLVAHGHLRHLVGTGVASPRVGEPHPVELDLAAQLARVDRVRAVHHVRRRVEQVEDLVQGRHPLLVGRIQL
jgi:hypothetical protein